MIILLVFFSPKVIIPGSFLLSQCDYAIGLFFSYSVIMQFVVVVVVVVDPTPPTCCQQSPAPESCGSQQSLPPGGKERLHFVGIRPEVQARKGGW